jgi:hypothetical protein
MYLNYFDVDIKNKIFKIKIIILIYLKKIKNNYYYNTKQATKKPRKNKNQISIFPLPIYYY